MTLPDLLRQIEAEYQRWIDEKKTGEVSVRVKFNEGGIRGSPKIITEKDLK